MAPLSYHTSGAWKDRYCSTCTQPHTKACNCLPCTQCLTQAQHLHTLALCSLHSHPAPTTCSALHTCRFRQFAAEVKPESRKSNRRTDSRIADDAERIAARNMVRGILGTPFSNTCWEDGKLASIAHKLQAEVCLSVFFSTRCWGRGYRTLDIRTCLTFVPV